MLEIKFGASVIRFIDILVICRVGALGPTLILYFDLVIGLEAVDFISIATYIN